MLKRHNKLFLFYLFCDMKRLPCHDTTVMNNPVTGQILSADNPDQLSLVVYHQQVTQTKRSELQEHLGNGSWVKLGQSEVIHHSECELLAIKKTLNSTFARTSTERNEIIQLNLFFLDIRIADCDWIIRIQYFKKLQSRSDIWKIEIRIRFLIQNPDKRF